LTEGVHRSELDAHENRMIMCRWHYCPAAVINRSNYSFMYRK